MTQTSKSKEMDKSFFIREIKMFDQNSSATIILRWRRGFVSEWASQAQTMLQRGKSLRRVARRAGVSEHVLRYFVQQVENEKANEEVGL